jgi:hypothetical protein
MLVMWVMVLIRKRCVCAGPLDGASFNLGWR